MNWTTIGLAAIAAAATEAAKAQSPTLTVLPVVPAGGEIVVSPDGNTIFGRSYGLGSSLDQWMWTRWGGMISLNMPNTEITAVSFDGSVIGGTGQYGVVFVRLNGVIVPLPHAANGGSPTEILGLSRIGTTGVGMMGGDAFLWKWSVGRVFVLPRPAGYASVWGLGLSDSGDVIAETLDSATTGFRAFVWRADWGTVDLGVLPGLEQSFADAISADGRTIVGVCRGGTDVYVPYRWTLETGMRALPVPPGTRWSGATAVSGDGSVIVGLAAIGEDDGVVIWTENGGMTRLADLLVPSGVLPAGTILGNGALPHVSEDGHTFVGLGLSGVGGYPWIATFPAGFGCYANCDSSTAPPVLNINDYLCFLNRYAAGDTYANCDGSSADPVLNVNDFQCFLNKFAAGCS